MSKQIMPIILDKDFNKIGIIDTYQSIIWTTRYYDHGDFELVLSLNSINFYQFSNGYYVTREDDDNVGIIEKLEARLTETGAHVLTISGRFCTQILARRIIAEQTEVSGTVAEAINQLITDAIISPTISARQISNFTLGDYSTEETIEAQYTGKNLYTVIHDICVQYGLGFKVTLNENNQFVFELYKGVNRAWDQTENPYFVFSNQFDNLLNAEFLINYMNTVNAVLSAGEGEGDQRKTIWVQTESNPSGLDRYEYYDDARNTSTNEGEISDQEYLEQLSELGKECFTPYDITIGGEVDFSAVKFKTDVNVGDIVIINDSTVQFTFKARIIEVIESIDASGKYSIIPTFGQ